MSPCPSPRRRLVAAAIAAVCLLLLGTAHADQSYSATISGSATANLTGSVYDVDCPCEWRRLLCPPPAAAVQPALVLLPPCLALTAAPPVCISAGGWVTAFSVGTYLGALSDIQIQCSDGGSYSYASASVANTTYGGFSGNASSGFQSVAATAGTTAISAFGRAGSDLDCGAGNVIILQAYVYANESSQQIISVSVTCAAPSDVTCGGAAPAACLPGYILEADTQACSPCQLGTYYNSTQDACLAW